MEDSEEARNIAQAKSTAADEIRNAAVREAFEIVMMIVAFIRKLGEEQVADAISVLSHKEDTYGLLWGDLTPAGRRRANHLLKLMDLEREILEVVQKFQTDEATWTLISRVASQKTVNDMMVKAEKQLQEAK